MSSGLLVAVLAALVLVGYIPQIPRAEAAVTDELNLKQPSDVTVKCWLFVLSDGTLSSECEFENQGTVRKRFVYCYMIDLKTDRQGPVPGLTKTDYEVVQVTEGGQDKLKCQLDPPHGSGSDSSFHFGCKLVDLQPGQSVRLTFDSGGVPYQPPAGVAPNSWDFQVSYADTIDLTAEPGKVYDEASCQGVIGQGNFLVPRTPTSAWWQVFNQPFEDPYVAFQPLDLGIPAPPSEYALFDDSPCLPSEFPLPVVDLPACPTRTGPPPPVSVDLNLFYFETHSAPVGTEFPVFLSVETRGNISGIRIETVPAVDEVFIIPGGVEFFGRLRVCAVINPTECIAPVIVEGRRLQVTVNIFDATTGEFLFCQIGEFIQDTEPAFIAHSVQFDSSNNLHILVNATDEISSPMKATFWYSTDGGDTWDSVLLETSSDLLRELPTRTFTGTVGPLASGASVQYFIAVEDVVFNIGYLGIGEETVPQAPQPVWVLIAAIIAIVIVVSVSVMYLVLRRKAS